MERLLHYLLHDDRQELFNFLVALALNILFLGVIALLLWPLGNLGLAVALARGYGLLWLGILLTAVVLHRIQRGFRMDSYHRVNAYVISTLAVSCSLQVGWAAFAGPAVHDAMSGGPLWLGVILYLVGLLSCPVAFLAVCSIYSGQIYQLISFPLLLLSFLVFSAWPAGGRALGGWLG